MAKKLITVLLAVTIIACSSISVFATENTGEEPINTGNEKTQAELDKEAADKAAVEKKAEEAKKAEAAKKAAAKKAAAKKAKAEKFKKGLAAYIRSVNGNVSKSKSLKMAQYFINDSKKYGTDVYYIMAIAKNESTFYTNATAPGGRYRGLMQTSTNLAKSYGYKAKDLYKANVSIRVGTRCLKSNLKTFKNNYKKALSAYAYGSYAVKKGNYSTDYYKKFTSTRKSIKSYLKKHKYV